MMFAKSLHKPGDIVQFYNQTIASLGNGWAFCDGTNGTPDMRGVCVFGVANDGEMGDVGGAETHTHPVSLTTGTPSGMPNNNVSSGYYSANNSHTHSVSGNTSSGSSLPPYIKVGFKMKL